MSDPRINRSEPTTPRPGTTPMRAAPTATIEATPRMGGDQASFGARPAPEPAGSGARETLDSNGWWASTQTFLQGATRAGALAGRTLLRFRAFATIADVLDGDRHVIGRGVERLTTGASNLATKVAPKYADDAMKVAAPVIKGGGAVVRAIGKAAPVFNVVAAVWDTYKAATEDDPAKKAGAWANAGLSVGGTAMALGAVALGATPVGWALGIGAAAVAGFQLVDNLAFGGKATQAIGEGVAAVASGAKNAAKAAWGAITSL